MASRKQLVGLWVIFALLMSYATFYLGGLGSVFFLLKFPNQYGLWGKAVIAIPSLLIGQFLWMLFKAAGRKWEVLKPLFFIEGQIAIRLASPLLLVLVGLFLESPAFGWLVFGTGGAVATLVFLLVWVWVGQRMGLSPIKIPPQVPHDPLQSPAQS